MTIDILSPGLLLFACAVTLGAGFVKGAVGFAMPLIMVSGLSALIDPQLAIAALIVPTFASNLLQIARAGRAESLAAAWDFRRFVLAACVMIFVVTQLLVMVPSGLLFLAVGVPVLAMAMTQLAGLRFAVRPSARPVSDLVVGAIAGGIGGIAGTWGPPTVLYLLALGVDRARQMAVQGVVYFLGSVMLLAGHLTSGLLDRETLPLSLVLLVPAGFGMWAGFRFGDRLDAARFRRLTLIVLIVAALNLIRRGLLG